MSGTVYKINEASNAPIPFPTGHARFLALRDELRARTVDGDLAEVWDTMARRERSIVLRAADMPVNRACDELARFDRESRVALRDALHRMSSFASGLIDRCQKGSHPSSELAAQARTALDAGDIDGCKHFLALIESMA